MITVHFDKDIHKCADAFNSGNSYLDSFIKSHMAMDDSIGRTYVYLTEDKKELIGYYNISTGSLQSINHITGDAIKFKIGGAVHINAFAVDEAYQGEVLADMNILYADFLLDDCLQRILELRKDVGFEFVTLASTQSGYKLYKRFGFDELEDDMHLAPEKDEIGCTPMYLSLDWEE